MRKILIALTVAMTCATVQARDTYNFNSQWTIDNKQQVTLPRAWNEKAAYAVECNQMPDSVVWYRKTFRLPKMKRGDRVLIEFEGAKQAAEVWLNKKRVGLSENGVMAFGFDLTPYIKKGDNLIEVMTDNNIDYRERSSNSKFQWNYNNFNCNYGGLTKNVKLHIVPATHQTLPLYRDLGTTGQYIYGSNYDIDGHTCTINVETQVSAARPEKSLRMDVIVEEMDGREVARFSSPAASCPAGLTTLKASKRVGGLHFWSWGYGYLYRVKTIVGTDTVTTTTGFRKAEFKEGMIWLNNRVMMVHGYAQRSTNEWPGAGNAVPAWLSDYSNALQVESGGNLVRWMHITPSKQDIESCDRVGLIQAMPAGDSEKDVDGRRWEQRVEVMRDAIIYNRNNPSILFYECGNNNIGEEHMAEMKALKEKYDPNGMRAIGSRNMLSSRVAEYGGEMLYVNKSSDKPMWQMEYCRDEGVRKYWNSWSYPYHKQGDGPLYRNAPAPAYNQNMDELAVEFVRRWYDYWLERPGQGTKVNSGGVKIIFSDSQSHSRGETNYRTSGVVDAMRIPKDAFYTHQVMWSGWVDEELLRTHIIGHWNYNEGDTIPRIYVVSNADTVTLKLNNKPLNIKPKHSYRYLWTFENVPYEAGDLAACGKGWNGRRADSFTDHLHTAGKPVALRLTKIENPTGWKADGADVALVEIEAIDAQGRRAPLADNAITYEVEGEAEYLGGVANGREDNYARSTTLPLNAGVSRIMLRSTPKAGHVVLTAKTDQLASATVSFDTKPIDTRYGLSRQMPADGLACRLTRGETPQVPLKLQKRDIAIVSAEAPVAGDKAALAFDGDESTSWQSDGQLENAWITFNLAEQTPATEVCLKTVAFRSKAYPIEICSGDEVLWKGYTPKSLSFVRLPLKPHRSNGRYTIRMYGSTNDGDAFGAVKEMAKENDEKKVSGKSSLRILEIQFICNR